MPSMRLLWRRTCWSSQRIAIDATTDQRSDRRGESLGVLGQAGRFIGNGMPPNAQQQAAAWPTENGAVCEPREVKMTSYSDEELDRIEVTVVALIPEYQQVLARAADGRQYVITERADGVPWRQLREGQRIVCLVTKGLPRVRTVDTCLNTGPHAACRP